MAYLTWLIAGIVMLAITLFIHKHTTSWRGDKLPLPFWGFLIGGIMACIPVINLVAFVAGAVIYIVNIADGDFEFSYEAAWYKRLIDLLTYDLNKT